MSLSALESWNSSGVTLERASEMTLFFACYVLRFKLILPSSNGDSLDPWRYINHVLSENRN